MDTSVLSEKLVTLRKRKGLTQIELANKINYSDKVISKWERGESLPGIEAYKILADFYGVSVDQLISDDKLVDNVINRRELDLERTQGPSSFLKLSILIPLILFIVGTVQALWDGPTMFWVYSIGIFLVYSIVWSVLIVYVTDETTYKGHKIKFVNKPLAACLYIDDNLVDANHSLLTLGYKLTGKIDNETIKANISANTSIKCRMFVE